MSTLAVRLDPTSRDLHGQNAELRAQGPVVRVELPGGVTAWAVTGNRLLRELLSDSRVVADPRHWKALADGQISDGWPLIDFVRVGGMTNADGPDHRRLRGLVTQAFTPRRVAAMRPAVERTVEHLLDDLAAAIAGPTGSADLIEVFAYPLPLTVICDLLGFPVEQQAELHRLWTISSRSVITPAEKIANSAALFGMLAAFVAARRADPRADLTGALIAAVTDDGEVLTESELVGTLLTLLIAGHGTVTKLLTNAVRALFAHPEQRARVTSGAQPWSTVIEETLRWDGPLGHFPMRYAAADIELTGTTIRQGDAIILSYAAAGRDPEVYGPDADRFDPARPAFQHLSFGHGVHFCLGRQLAQLEAGIALPALFDRFPDLAAAEDLDRLVPMPSIVGNSVRELPVRTGQ